MEKQEKQGHIGELIESTLNNIRSFAQTNTIIGTPIQAEGVTLIPVSRMSVGYGGGGMELSTKDGKVADGSYGGGVSGHPGGQREAASRSAAAGQHHRPGDRDGPGGGGQGDRLY